MVKVSIVLPIYNVANYLTKNLESLRNQTYTNVEFLCVNDGSTDHSGEIIDEFVKKDARFVRLDKKNGGLSDARNYGMERASGKYIMFPDSDDYVAPTMIEECVNRMEHDQLDLVVFDYMQHYDYNNTDERISLDLDDQKIYSFEEDVELVAKLNNAAWNKMYRLDLFQTHGFVYPFGYRHQDLGTTFRYLTVCKRIGYIKEPLYSYLADRPNNISQMIDKKLYHIVDMCKINVDYYQEKGLFEKYADELQYLCMINFMVALRKAVTLKDQRFVFKFIDDVFDFMELHFKKKPWGKYQPAVTSSDSVYLNRTKCKLYYFSRKIRGKS